MILNASPRSVCTTTRRHWSRRVLALLPLARWAPWSGWCGLLRAEYASATPLAVTLHARHRLPPARAKAPCWCVPQRRVRSGSGYLGPRGTVSATALLAAGGYSARGYAAELRKYAAPG